MNAFEVLFIFLFLGSVCTLAVVLGYLLFGRRDTALGILRRFTISLIAYLAIVIVASFGASRRKLSLGDPLCFDDWCITIQSVQLMQSQAGDVCVVTANISSRARRAPQRENGVVLYLTDNIGD